MALLTSVFQKLLSMALTALPVTAVVLLARFFLRKAPKKFSCVLWLAVAFRLVCPVAPEGAVGIVRGPETARWVEDAAETYMEPTLTYRDNGGFTPDYEVLLNRGYTPNARGEIVTNEAGTREAYQVADLMGAAALVWLAGMAAMLGWMALSYLRLRRLVAAAVRRERDVWECGDIPSPFVMGLFRPRIYVPFHLDNNQRTYVMAHERYHIRRKDPWWKLLGCLILAVYWWDIAVWLCWALFCRDLEMSCDEAVLDQLGDQAKAGYSLSLVDFAQAGRFPAALAFGEHDAARRVKNVLSWKRARPAAVFLALAAVLLVVSVCVHDAKPARESRVTLGTGENGGAVFTVRAAENVRSWAIYEDIYEDGMLVSSTHRVFDGFQDQGDGASPREFEGSLRAEASYHADGGFEGTLTMHYEAVGGRAFDLTLPKDRYTSMGMLVGGDQTQFRLKPEEEVTLYTVLLSTEPDGAVAMSGDLTRANDTVVRYRLVLSGGSYTELENPPLDLAQTLYDLRTDSTADTASVQRLLDILGTGELGTYELSVSGGERETVLTLTFDAELDERRELDMWDITQVLLALVGDLDRVDYSFPTENGASLMTVYCDGTPVGSWAESMGYESVKDLARTARGVRELLNYLGWDQTEIAPTNRVTGEDPTGEVPYLAHGGCVAQYAYDLAEDVKTAGLWAVLYQNGVPVSEGPLWQASPGTEEFPRQGRFWLRYGVSDAAGGWDRMRLEVGPWSGETGQVWKPWDSVSFQFRRGYGAGGGREERTLEGTASLSSSGAVPIFAAYISGSALEAVPVEELGDINTLQETVRSNDVVLAVWLSLSAEEDTLTKPATGLESETFYDILGYDGYLVTASWPQSAYWSTRTYYAADPATGDLTPIAESFGDGGPQDYAVDLDGDGVKELVSNVVYGGDGAVKVLVYQRRADGIYMGYLDTEDLPGHFDWGINSVWEEYDPAENVFRIHYAVEGQEDYAVLETRGLERVVFYQKYEP